MEENNLEKEEKLFVKDNGVESSDDEEISNNVEIWGVAIKKSAKKDNGIESSDDEEISNNINSVEIKKKIQRKNVKQIVKKVEKPKQKQEKSEKQEKVDDYEDSCTVCADKFTGMIRKCITCPNCFYKQCRECVKRYVLSSTQNPHCMNCKVEWKKAYLFEILPKVFMEGEYKKHREDVLLEREKSFLVESMPYAERRMEEKRLDKQITAICDERDEIIRKYEKQLSVLRKQRYQGIGEEKVERKEFVKKCPVDDCNGFLSTQWKCGLCETWVCPDCLEIKGKEKNCEHICNPDIVESAKLLKKETKPCPKCNALIFKISGCSQIWCTQCHTAFDFNTGKIETVIHNPHYFEYMNKVGNVPRQPGDIPCGGLPYVNEVNKVLKMFFNKKTEMDNPYCPGIIRTYFSNFLRILTHIERYELEHYRQDPTVANRELRVDYILKKLDEETWKKELQIREKKIEKTNSIESINNTILMAGTDILQRFLGITTIEQYIDLVCEAEYLREYSNNEFVSLGKIFSSSSMSYITKGWENYDRKQKQYYPKRYFDTIEEHVQHYRTRLRIWFDLEEGEKIIPFDGN